MKKAPSKAGKKAAPKNSASVAIPDHAEDMKYRAQDALHTLRRADEIKSDPALMAHVKRHAMEQREHLNKVIRRKS